MIRLFVAIEIPAELRLRMTALCAGVERARWVPEENLHLTLRFIGEVGEDVGEDVVAALSALRGEPFAVTVVGAGHFATGRRVRALWLGVDRTPALDALRRRVESALVRSGLAPEQRKYSPHVTLARLPGAAPGEVSGWLAANALFRAAPFVVERFVLFSSHLGRAGAIYTPEAAFPLAPPA